MVNYCIAKRKIKLKYMGKGKARELSGNKSFCSHKIPENFRNSGHWKPQKRIKRG